MATYVKFISSYCEKSAHIQSFSGPCYLTLGLNTERYGDTEYLSVFSSNAGKYGPEKTPYLDTFHAVLDPHINKAQSEAS